MTAYPQARPPPAGLRWVEKHIMTSNTVDRAPEPSADGATILPPRVDLHGRGAPATAVAHVPWAGRLLGRVRRPFRSSAKLAAGRGSAKDWAYLTQVGSRLQGDAWMRLVIGARRRSP